LLFSSEAEARADIEGRLQADAALLCAVADTQFERVAGVNAEATQFDCRQTAAGWTCAADYRAVCAVERRELVQRCPG
jgi:hypothetical protein